MHKYGKQSTLSDKETISTCCRHSVVKIFLNFCRYCETIAKKEPSPVAVNFELLCLLDEVGKIDRCGGIFVCVSPSKQPVQHVLRQLKNMN